MNNRSPDKPFKNFDEQIEILVNRNIIIKNIDFAKHVLNTVSYYKLINGYKESLIVNDSNEEPFKDGITIEFLYDLHIFDITLQSILFKYILAIETSLKTKISYLIANKYGVFERNYLSSQNYISSGRKRRLRSAVLNELNSDKVETMYTPTRYYRDGDISNDTPAKNHIPPWILIQNISFTRAIRWYSILKSADKKEIYRQFPIIKNVRDTDSIETQYFLDSLKILRDYRNNVAHGYRSINVSITNSVRIEAFDNIIPNNVLSISEFDTFGKNDLYSVLISIESLTDYTILETTFIKELSALFNSKIGEEVKKLANLPDDFLERLEKLKTAIS